MQQVWRKGSFDDWRKKPFITFFGEMAVFEVSIFFYGLMPCCVCLRWVPKVVSTRKPTSEAVQRSQIVSNSRLVSRACRIAYAA